MKLIENHIETLKKLCETYHVDKMYLFGSALKTRFSSAVSRPLGLTTRIHEGGSSRPSDPIEAGTL